MAQDPKADLITIARAQFLAQAMRFDGPLQVLDIGANPTHRAPYADLIDARLAEVHGFEPHPQAFERLEQMKSAQQHYYNHAVGDGRAATFYQCENGSFSSLYRPSAEHFDYLGHWGKSRQIVAEHAVQTITLDTTPGLAAPDFVKMDVQGAEHAILKGGRRTIENTVCIMPEIRYFRLYEGEKMFGVVDNLLRDCGFMLLKILPGACLRLASSRSERLRGTMARSQMIDADAVYIRDLTNPDNYTARQLGCLALLADAVFDSKDLVLRCLDLMVARGVLEDSALDTYLGLLPAAYVLPAQPAAPSKGHAAGDVV